MNILLIGSGGREHALAWAIAKSKHTDTLFIAPGNAGMEECGQLVQIDVDDHAAVAEFCADENVQFVVVGPEQPLVDGLSDVLRECGLKVFGPSQAAAQLEGSKYFTKALCDEMNVPTAAYGKFDALEPALAYLQEQGAPIVIKADGLAAGKGVTVAETLEQAEAAVRDCFDGTFGEAGASVVIEECLVGEEASLFALSDGKNIVLLPSAQDHKRAFDGDKGPNTGGMGAYSPAPVMTEEMLERTRKEIIEPSIKGMADRGTPFTGVLFIGLMITTDGPKLIEYNVRFGDPECQVLMMRLKSDIVELLSACADGTLNEENPQFDDTVALTVVMAADGYPGSYEKGTQIRGLESVDDENVKVFHAGTKRDGDKLVANGGRVLNVTAKGTTVQEARDRAYAAIDKIDWPEGFCRKDIAWRAIERG
ncbi:phosphoribosylamine--glycine ligase [Maritalea porphyrae]|uniref:Phosphoribosylamine--glycine ligase n=1 Tax=Maritalea porphyrae TaxID=880732 RepID=A0ABQ5USL6_9HYPH|nr:phosphoribosylamine--glycine ligase [Maritalea porphyrae]GLQ17755.1 phosphoribosylamine--glycine ligase [Maritalea porphyrae]